MELIARIAAVETVRVKTLVTKQTELALNALLDGKINFVTKVRTLQKTYVKAESFRLFFVKIHKYEERDFSKN